MFKISTTAALILAAVAASGQTDTTEKRSSLQEVVVSGIVARPQMPVTQITLSQKQIEERYYGADIPTMINFTPSVNTYSDNGTGIGYSYFRLRGLDQSRINFTINGIPVNDPENQGVFFNNFADLASSAQSLQVQRGVGTSTNGAAAFGGSVSLLTKSVSDTSGFTLRTGYGSFNSRRLTAEYQSGLLANKFAFYGRFSDVATDGYREHSGSHIRSMFLSGAYFGKKSVLKLNVMTGSAESQLAYQGIDQPTLDANRKSNPFVNNERDAFVQDFYQVQYTYQLSANAGISASAYYVHGNAPRFQVFLGASPYLPFSFYNLPDAIVGNDTISQTDAIGSYRLNQDFYGAFVNYYYKKGKLDLNLGLHANAFRSEHFLEVNWARVLPANAEPDHQAYFNTGYKNEASAFAKITYQLSDRFNVFADLQLRGASFSYSARDMQYHRDTFDVTRMTWLFFNPRVGARYGISGTWSAYIMAGRTSREPTRSDYFQDEFATRNIRQSEIRPETVNDLELGVNASSRRLSAQANVYFMYFENQILNTGQLNTVGYPITVNVGSSYRSGIELDLLWKATPYLWIINSSAVSRNRISSVAQFYTKADGSDTGIVYNNVNPVLTPQVIINQGFRVIPTSWLYAELTGRYVSQQYLDNSNDDNLAIKSFYFLDARIGLSLARIIRAGDPSLIFQVNNITNQHYTPSGSIQGYSNTVSYDAGGNPVKGSVPLYFPAAGTNFFATLQWKF